MITRFQDAFILDAGNGGVFVWVGKGCTMDERKKAMSHATEYLEQMVNIYCFIWLLNFKIII